MTDMQKRARELADRLEAARDKRRPARTAVEREVAGFLRALAAQPAEPVAWMWQHDETGRIGFVECWQVENGWQQANPRCKLIRPLVFAGAAPPQASQPAEPVAWRCFHCGDTFEDEPSAREHFGATELSKPACVIDAAEYRRMEARMRSYNEEDSELHRQIYRMNSEHQTALRRQEELGYARGLRDALEPQGWRPIETAPKDGAYVLVGNSWGAWVAKYQSKAVSGYVFDEPWRSCMLNHWHIYPKSKQYDPPTHWMPLPAAPKEPTKPGVLDDDGLRNAYDLTRRPKG